MILACVLVLIIVLVGCVIRHRSRGEGMAAAENEAPRNMQVYDAPYKYPNYAETAVWDGDRRCSSFCGDKCRVWCR
jgi:hypothetical protein